MKSGYSFTTTYARDRSTPRPWYIPCVFLGVPRGPLEADDIEIMASCFWRETGTGGDVSQDCGVANLLLRGIHACRVGSAPGGHAGPLSGEGRSLRSPWPTERKVGHRKNP